MLLASRLFVCLLHAQVPSSSAAPSAPPGTAANGSAAAPASAPANASDLDRALDAAARAADSARAAADAAAKAAEAAEKAAGALQAARPAAPAMDGGSLAVAGVGEVAVAAPPLQPTQPWSGTAGLGLISLTGNSKSLTLNANGQAERKTDDWIFGVKGSGVYSQSQAFGTPSPSVLAAGASGQLRLDRRFTPQIAAYGLAGSDTDHVNSLEYRVYGEPGVSVMWIDTKEADYDKILLRTDLGMRFAYDSRYQYYPTLMVLPDVTFVGPRLGGEFKYCLTKDSLFLQDFEVMTNVDGASRTLANTLSKVALHLLGPASIAASFAIAYDSAPPPGKLPTDTTLTVSLQFTF